MRIPVLCYHRVLPEGQPSPPSSAGFVGHTGTVKFREQMAFLAANGMQAITHEDLIDGLNGRKELPARPVMIDFDDTRLAVLENAWPIMKEFGFAGTEFVISDVADHVELPHMGSLKDFPPMGWKELRTLMDDGWCMGGHTKSHFWLKEMCEEKGIEAVEHEVEAGKRRIEEMLNRPARAFAYPGGTSNDEVEQVVKRHFESARLWYLGAQEIERVVERNVESARMAVSDLSVDYVTEDTDIYRIPCANISCRTEKDVFEKWICDAIR